MIEGYVAPAEEKAVEGPFGDHTGFYSLEDRYPLFHVTALTRRRDAVYPATVVGIPPQEDAWLARATERIFLAPIRMALQPEVRDLTMPDVGTAHIVAVVSIDRRYEGQAVKVAQSLWGAGQMMFNKYLLVVPSGTDVRDSDALARLCGLTPELREGCVAALDRWLMSSVRAELLAWPCVRAEVPFFSLGCEDEDIARYGAYAEGAIDALATNPADSSRALVIDYKTGGTPDETPEQLQEKHALQARVYADVLHKAGFEAVTVKFVRVEQANPAIFVEPAEPQVVTYNL